MSTSGADLFVATISNRNSPCLFDLLGRTHSRLTSHKRRLSLLLAESKKVTAADEEEYLRDQLHQAPVSQLSRRRFQIEMPSLDPDFDRNAFLFCLEVAAWRLMASVPSTMEAPSLPVETPTITEPSSAVQAPVKPETDFSHDELAEFGLV
jgi:hypothetical protein